jgi:hypothetical protein
VTQGFTWGQTSIIAAYGREHSGSYPVKNFHLAGLQHARKLGALRHVAYKTSAARTMPMTYCKHGLAFMGAVFFELAGTAAAQSPDG